jgi:hypothetical protein
MSCGIFVQFFNCEILMLGKFVSFIASRSRTGRGGLSDLRAGGHQVDNLHAQLAIG